MGSANKEPQRLLCWTVCAYRKPGMDEDSYHKYMSEVHAPLVKDLMVQYGMVHWSMVSLSLSLPAPHPFPLHPPTTPIKLTSLTTYLDAQHHLHQTTNGRNRRPTIQQFRRL